MVRAQNVTVCRVWGALETSTSPEREGVKGKDSTNKLTTVQ